LPLFLFGEREAERCQWQMQRGAARANQGENKLLRRFRLWFAHSRRKSGAKRKAQE
jgi:hypothetical protein